MQTHRCGASSSSFSLSSLSSLSEPPASLSLRSVSPPSVLGGLCTAARTGVSSGSRLVTQFTQCCTQNSRCAAGSRSTERPCTLSVSAQPRSRAVMASRRASSSEPRHTPP